MADDRPPEEAAHIADPQPPSPSSASSVGHELTPTQEAKLDELGVSVGDLVETLYASQQYERARRGVQQWLMDGQSDIRLRILRHLCERWRSPTADAATYDSLRHHVRRDEETIRHHLDALEAEVRDEFLGDDEGVAWLAGTPADEVDAFIVERTRRFQQPSAISFVNRDVYLAVSVVGGSLL